MTSGGWSVDADGIVYDFPSGERIGVVDESGGIALDEDRDRDD